MGLGSPRCIDSLMQRCCVELLAEVEEAHVFVVVDHGNALLGPNNA